MKIDERVATVGELRRLTRILGRLSVADDASLTNYRTGKALHLSIEIADDEPFDGGDADDEE